MIFICRKTFSISFPKINAVLFGCLIALTMGTSSANGQSSTSRLIGAEYILSDATVKVQWDLVSNAQGYEARLTLFLNDPITYYALARIPGVENSIVFSRPRSGHFRAEVRACRYADCHCEPDADPDPCADDVSRWAESTNPEDATVDGASMGWWIYWQTPKPDFIIGGQKNGTIQTKGNCDFECSGGRS